MLQAAPTLETIDHLVLTVADINATIAFYENALNMKATVFMTADAEQRHALTFGSIKINLHESGAEFEPKSTNPTPGSADLCFLTHASLDDWMIHLAQQDVRIEEGPVPRTGATGPLMSIYLRDPDRNLIEIAARR
ncbi:putative ring-cleaving dioxygenase [Sulfitobacter noctilucicola]|uniref:Catechol 2,3-dioxygenase-like lactoylglutathione lyase family enzyme n=1 Tax=Sulfitobacter noctilucicola TaxID=1342301 RepID=A0A7W6M6G6_9RHOB|nr:VOC family protein [Sulfitobacter noctilucicola]KIN62487.1 putative ring-cleaving dioxygenase [Sulfitobacter noctilucicola]MBB4172983.1 catechol 2,3-dioxygenase-like lactoylglutathione lyase family enzyme [Sulfitobacter noctilucicola]